MNRGEFRSLVVSICKFSGVQYIEDAQQINTLINERMRKFAERTFCLYDDAIPFTLQAGTAVYNLRGSAFNRELIQADKVYIEGSPLADFEGHFGPVRLEELIHRQPTYLTAATSRPICYCHIPPHSLRLFPGPSDAFSDCFAAGWYLPSTIGIAASGDSTLIPLPEEYHRTLAYYTAVSLLIPNSTGELDYQKLTMLSQESAAEMSDLESRSRRLILGPSIRGTNRTWR